MCGRCSGFRGAVALAPRSSNHEIVHVGCGADRRWQTLLIVFGMMGVAAGAFHWPVSPWFIALKQGVARWLVERDVLWPLETTAPWWVLTNYPAQSDVLTILDGATLLLYILSTALVSGTTICAFLALAVRTLGRWSWTRFHHLAQSLVPVATCSIFLGLSSMTVTLLSVEGLWLDWVGPARAALIAAASLWTLWLAWCIGRRYVHSRLRATFATVLISGAVAAGATSPVLLFWIW
jgi:hypothetical protein